MPKEKMPFGLLYKKMTDGKYANVVDVREDLLDSLVFCDALAAECKRNVELSHKGVLHFTMASDSAGLYGVKTDQGSYFTFERLLENTPAVVAGKNFITDTILKLLDVTSYLHDQGICHLCFAPCNVLVRKNESSPILLFHGSFYSAMNDQRALWGDVAVVYLAPEVLQSGTFDTRSDIYSIGKFMEFLYRQSEVPFELKGVIKKATKENPDQRYQTPEEMQRAISGRQNLRRSVLSFVAALVIALLVYGFYVSITPEPEDIEYVKPAVQETPDDLLDDGMNLMTEMGPPTDTTASKVDERKMREYQAKAEQIFRKQFTRKAEGILQKIYSNERMNATEKAFLAGSQSTLQELVREQMKLGSEAGLANTRSQLIAGQIIDALTNKLKSEAATKRRRRVHGAKSTRKVTSDESDPQVTVQSQSTETAAGEELETAKEEVKPEKKSLMEREKEAEKKGKPFGPIKHEQDTEQQTE